jgi:hypothetical protein
MLLHVNYEYRDYREALRAAGMGTGFLGLYGWIIALNMAIMCMRFLPEAPPAGAPTAGRQSLLPVLTVVAIFSALIIVTLLTYLGSLRRLKSPKPRKGIFGIIGWIVATLSLAGFAYLAASTSNPQLRRDAIAGAIPFIIILGIVTLMAWWFGKAYYRRYWASLEELHRPRSIQIDDGGVGINDGAIATSYAWRAFVRWRETENLFVLYTSKIGFVMIPKRAIGPDASAVATLRAMCNANINAPTITFPVRTRDAAAAMAPRAGA